MPTVPTYRSSLGALATLGLALTFTACKGFQAIDASFPNVTASDTVYALNGSPPGSPNSLKFFEGLVDRADQGFGFDIAFDIDPAGNVLIIPARALATTFSSPYSVALQRVSGPFEAIVSAPESGYRPDTATAVNVGETIVAESRDNTGICAFSLKGQAYYSKLVVTEVDPAKRRIIFTLTVNRNCGFRSFAPGFPED